MNALAADAAKASQAAGGPIDLERFRRGMRRLTGAVSLVTTLHEEQPHGLTATAVCSLSGTPPRLLACVNVAGRTFEFILRARRMGINVLGMQHIDLAKRFANMAGGSEQDRFGNAIWITPHSGAPILADALVGFDCMVDEMFVTPSHGVIIGEIKHVNFGPTGAPLLYHDGAFTTLHEMP